MNYQENALKMLKEIEAEIALKTDNRKKTIGDRVVLWDYYYNQSKSGKSYCKLDNLDGIEAIIIAENQKRISKSDYNDQEYILDLVLLYPNREEIYTWSGAVKRIDNCL